MSARLEQQLAFLTEVDKLKSVNRGNILTDRSRPENSAEHSWHVALFALVMADQADARVDLARVIQMLLIHDIVEIDAGDNPIFDVPAVNDIEAEEKAAADRLFGMLPKDQAQTFRALWDEFEAAATPDAVFAKAIDRALPPVLNLASNGGTWAKYNVTEDRVDQMVGTKVARGAPALWDHLKGRIHTYFQNAS
ncbi:HD family hydrolase [Cognatishimia sp. MH4019]|uniref:HD domain-containing protein n=1 Tax=Cognatishimia sp. MH4019 TaxID=2854030 RepID=UPI001CD7E74D|nr:HD domain-containing protein [Cognatishimia sp. MH4019]